MTKEEYLLSLPFHRKNSIYIGYLDYNKYFDDMDNEFYEELFEENILDIMTLLNYHSSLLNQDEWDIYENLKYELD